jgi:hypothetical protein
VTGILDQVSRSLPHQNLREALDHVFMTHEKALEAVNALMRQHSNSKFDKQLSKISQIRSFCGLFHFVQGVFLKFLGGIFHVKPPK